MKTRIIVLLLTLALLTALISGCSGNTPATTTTAATTTAAPAATAAATTTAATENAAAYPIVTDNSVTLDIGTWCHASTAPYEDLLVFQEYEKISGVHVNWITYPQSGFTERRNISFATGDLPDAYTKASMNVNDVMKFCTSGAIVPIDEMLPQYGPNLYTYLEEHPNINKGVTMLDGHIYGTPYILESSAIRVQARMFFDNVLMDAVGGQMPTTTTELIDYLKLVRDQDANGNGDKNDEIPLVTTSLNHIFQMTAGAFGLNKNGYSHNYVDMGENNQFRFLPTTDGYRDQLAFVRELYAEKLIDQEVFTVTSTDALASISQYQAGAIIWWSVSFISNTADYDRYDPLPAMLKGPNGDHDFTCVIGAVNSPAAFIITNKCKTPEIALRWIDYFYGEDGIKLYLLGIEGNTYEMGDNGIPYFTDKIMNNPDGLSFQQAYGQYCPQAGGANPTILTENYYISGEGLPKSREASNAIKDDIISFDNVWEKFIYTSAEAEVMSSLETDIASYYNEQRALFVSGELDIKDDATWDAYCAEYKNLGLDDYLTMYGIGYDRFAGK